MGAPPNIGRRAGRRGGGPISTRPLSPYGITVDLHLRENAACGECRTPHLHVCHRPGNPNRAEAKTKQPWQIVRGTVTGGLIKRVSPAMVHSYFEYITTEYPRGARHGMLLVQLHGADAGRPLAPVGARRMLGQGNALGWGW